MFKIRTEWMGLAGAVGNARGGSEVPVSERLEHRPLRCEGWLLRAGQLRGTRPGLLLERSKRFLSVLGFAVSKARRSKYQSTKLLPLCPLCNAETICD